jgi:hypothetical protein
MGHGADLGTELAADRKLIELVAAQYEAERDPDRRHLLAKRLTAIVARHLLLATGLLSDALYECAPEYDDELARTLLSQARELLRVEETRLLPALERTASWQVLEDLGGKVRAGRG